MFGYGSRRRRVARIVVVIMLFCCVYSAVVTGDFVGSDLVALSAVLSEEKKVDACLDAFDDSKYDTAISLANDILKTSKDPDVRFDASVILIYSTKWKSGCDSAIEAIESVLGAGRTQSSADKAELRAMADELAATRDAYLKDLELVKQMLSKNVDPKKATNLVGRYSASMHMLYGYDACVAGLTKYADGTQNDRNIAFAAKRAMIWVHTSEQNSEKAREVCLDLVRSYPDNVKIPKVVDTLCGIYSGKGNYDEGIKVLEQIAKDFPNSVAARCTGLKRADMLLSASRPVDAFSGYVSVIGTSDDQGYRKKALESIKRLVSNAEDNKEIDLAVRKLATSHPDTELRVTALLLLGRSCLKKKEIGQAEVAFQSAMNLSPLTPRGLSARDELVKLYSEKGNEALAKADARRALGEWQRAYETDNDQQARSERACTQAAALAQAGHYSEAHTLLNLVRANSSPGVTKIREHAGYLSASTYFKAGDYQSARPLLKDLVSTARYRENKTAAKDLLSQIDAVHPQ